MTDQHVEAAGNEAPKPVPQMKTLEPLVGTWRVSGGAEGTITYEWLEGGCFLLQHFDLVHEGHRVKGIEVIGHLRPFGEEPSPEITSRAYDNVGNTLDYVYEIEGDTLTIWAGAKGSPAYFTGTFSDDGRTNVGAWVYPGGGGYQSSMTRVS